MIRLNLWYLPPAFFVCRRAMGEAFTRHSLRPLPIRRAVRFITRGDLRRENAEPCVTNASLSHSRRRRRLGKGAKRRAHCLAAYANRDGGHASLCPPYRLTKR